MAQNGVSIAEVNIEEDEEAAKRVMSANQGNRTVPTFEIDGEWYTNPELEELAKLVGIS